MSESAAPEPDRADARVDRVRSIALSEDWAATVVGLLLIVLVLAGAFPGWLVP